MVISTREAEQLFEEVADFSRQASASGSGQKSRAEDVACKELRRSAWDGRRSASSHGDKRRSQSWWWERFQAQSSTSVCIQQNQVINGDVGPNVPHLLLARAPTSSLMLWKSCSIVSRSARNSLSSSSSWLWRSGRARRPDTNPLLPDRSPHDHFAHGPVSRQEGLGRVRRSFFHRRRIGLFPNLRDGRPAWQGGCGSCGIPRGRPRPRRFPPLDFGGRSRSAASLPSRPMTVAPGPSAAQEGGLDVAAIDHDPQRFPGFFHDRRDPFYQPGSQHELGGERPTAPLRNLGHRFLADIEHGPKRHANAPKHGCRTANERSPRYVRRVFLVGRSRRWAVMNACPFDFRPVTLGGGVVDDRQQPVGQRQSPQQQNQKWRGDAFGLASKGRQKVKIVSEVVADSGGAEPGSHGPSPVGKENTHQQDRQPPTVAGVQSRRRPLASLVPIFRTLPITYRIRHPWLSYHLGLGKHNVMEEPFHCKINLIDKPSDLPFFQKVQFGWIRDGYAQYRNAQRRYDPKRHAQGEFRLQSQQRHHRIESDSARFGNSKCARK